MNMNYIDCLMKDIESCKNELHFAHLEYDVADDDLRDSISYKIKYLNSRFDALTNRLKNHVFLERGESNNAKKCKIFKGFQNWKQSGNNIFS